MPQSEQTKRIKCGHCFWRGMLLFGNTVVYKTVIQKYFDDRFARVCKNDHNNISDAVQWNRSTGYSGFSVPLHKVKWLFWCAWKNLFFHLPLFTFTVFLTSQTPPQAGAKTFFCELRDFFPEIFHFHLSFLMKYFKMCIKTGWWKHSSC